MADDRLAAALRGFGPPGLAAIAVVLAGNFLVPGLSALLVLLWVRLSRTPWREIGFVRPRSWLALATGAALGVVFKLLMKAVVMPLLGGPPVNAAYHWLAGNTAMLPIFALFLIFVAGFGEETLFRGYAFQRLRALIGWGRAAQVGIVLFTSTWFGLLHF